MRFLTVKLVRAHVQRKWTDPVCLNLVVMMIMMMMIMMMMIMMMIIMKPGSILAEVSV